MNRPCSVCRVVTDQVEAGSFGGACLIENDPLGKCQDHAGQNTSNRGSHALVHRMIFGLFSALDEPAIPAHPKKEHPAADQSKEVPFHESTV
jgi:hypothetical protein